VDTPATESSAATAVLPAAKLLSLLIDYPLA